MFKIYGSLPSFILKTCPYNLIISLNSPNFFIYSLVFLSTLLKISSWLLISDFVHPHISAPHINMGM
jgi:hypothetical protein